MKPKSSEGKGIKIICGNCLEVMNSMPDNSIDAIVTDPPYGLSFMGKKWDYDVPSQEIWEEALRVLKPGGYLLAFAGTRTQHRMAVRIEDAGFEIRDMIVYVYGSGFPKSLNIGKAVDKIQGNERETMVNERWKDKYPNGPGGNLNQEKYKQCKRITNPLLTSKGNSEWEGWGTALKPALEPITVARKPLSEKNVAQNCLKWGVGGINIDGCRVGYEKEDWNNAIKKRESFVKTGGGHQDSYVGGDLKKPIDTMTSIKPAGRFPANLIHDGSDEVVGLFPNTKGGGSQRGSRKWKGEDCEGGFGGWAGKVSTDNYVSRDDGTGSAARFFYCAKSSRRERNNGLDCYLTVKYNNGICKEENMVAVQLLQKVISDSEVMSFNIGEYGESITAQCHKDSLSTILTEINKIIELKIYNSLMHSLTNESTQDVNLEMESGGNLAESVADLKRYLLTITKGQMELALGASRVVCEMLSLISEKENWKQATNFHSTVKPIALMEYLVKLVSKEGHTVLDPFMGSGSTGIACKKLGREFIGIEKESDYCKIAEARINSYKINPIQENLS